jgi:hypothetical protein
VSIGHPENMDALVKKALDFVKHALHLTIHGAQTASKPTYRTGCQLRNSNKSIVCLKLDLYKF